jgi:OmpA-OmpF porin, OOP family
MQPVLDPRRVLRHDLTRTLPRHRVAMRARWTLVVRGVAMLAGPLFVVAAVAQSGAGGDVIGARELSAQSVLEALDPNAVRTRSLRIGPAARTATASPPRASASLLITFETNAAELTPAARRQLDIVASALRNDRLATYGFVVEGHADPRGSPDGNLLLSQQRAQSVVRYLVTTHGIDAQRLQALGKGDREPLHPAQPAAAENRRVTFVTQAGK